MTLKADRALAADPETTDDVLIELLSHRDWHVRWNVAQNEGASDAVRLAALATGDKDLANAVGQLGDDLSPAVREAVFAHPTRKGRVALAQTAIDSSTLERLAVDPDPEVRGSVGQRAEAGAEILRRLAADRLAAVRGAVASNPAIPDDLAFALASDRSVGVRWWLLVMRDADPRFARLMRDDKDTMIRNHARVVLGEPIDED